MSIDNVAFPLEIAGMPQARTHRARAAFRRRWSASTASRSAIRPNSPAACASASRWRARSASEPKILLMDEPFAALDEQTRLLLGDKVLQIQQQLKQTTLLITHNITEAVQLADRILVMTYRPGQGETHRRHRPAAAAHLRDRVERSVRPLCRADLERFARGSEPRSERRRVARAPRRRSIGHERRGIGARAPMGAFAARARLAWCSAARRRNADPARRDQPLHRAAAVRGRREFRPRDHRGGYSAPFSADGMGMSCRRRAADAYSASPSAS